MKRNDFTIKGYKEFRGTDGYAFTCGLYFKGKRIAVVSDGGYGGEHDYAVLDKEKFAEFEKFVKDLGHVEPITEMDINFRKEYGPMEYNNDIFIDELTSDFLVMKQEKGWCRTKTVFSLPDDKEGEFRTYGEKYSPKMKAYVLKQHPTAIILNEKFL